MNLKPTLALAAILVTGQAVPALAQPAQAALGTADTATADVIALHQIDAAFDAFGARSTSETAVQQNDAELEKTRTDALTAQEIADISEPFWACLRVNAPVLDDHKSDPAALAQQLVEASCADEFWDMKMTFWRRTGNHNVNPGSFFGPLDIAAYGEAALAIMVERHQAARQ